MWIACHWLAMSNCCYNPIVYCWMNEKFRAGFRYAFRCFPCVRRPDVSPGGSSDWMASGGGGRSTGYGGMRCEGSATVVSFSATPGRSPRVQTDLVSSDSTPTRDRVKRSNEPTAAAGRLGQTELTLFHHRHKRRQAGLDQLQSASAESYQMKPMYTQHATRLTACLDERRSSSTD